MVFACRNRLSAWFRRFLSASPQLVAGSHFRAADWLHFAANACYIRLCEDEPGWQCRADPQLHGDAADGFAVAADDCGGCRCRVQHRSIVAACHAGGKMSLRIHVTGVQDTINAFRDLPRTIRNKHMRVALNAGAGVIRDATVANIPSESGLAKKSIKIKVRVPDASFNTKHHGRPAYAVIGPARGVVGRVARIKGRVKTITTRQAIKRSFGGGGFTTRRPSRYFHILEKGSKPHGIKVKDKRVLSSGEVVFGAVVKHPGTKPQAPLGKAVRSSGAAAQQKVLRKLHDGIANWASVRAARIRSKVGG